MSQNKKNEDLAVPTVFLLPYQPVLIDGFPQSQIPILWGPNQTGCNYNSYNPPASINDWRQFEQLNIPKVVRFHYNKGTLGNDSDDDGGGDTGDQRGIWKITNYQYGNHTGDTQLGVYWTLQEEPFFFYICFLGILDTPANFAAMQAEFPFGEEVESTKPIPDCNELGG